MSAMRRSRMIERATGLRPVADKSVRPTEIKARRRAKRTPSSLPSSAPRQQLLQSHAGEPVVSLSVHHCRGRLDLAALGVEKLERPGRHGVELELGLLCDFGAKGKDDVAVIDGPVVGDGEGVPGRAGSESAPSPRWARGASRRSSAWAAETEADPVSNSGMARHRRADGPAVAGVALRGNAEFQAAEEGKVAPQAEGARGRLSLGAGDLDLQAPLDSPFLDVVNRGLFRRHIRQPGRHRPLRARPPEPQQHVQPLAPRSTSA